MVSILESIETNWTLLADLYRSILCEFRFPGSFDAILALEPILSVQVLPEEVRNLSPWLSSRQRRDIWDST